MWKCNANNEMSTLVTATGTPLDETLFLIRFLSVCNLPRCREDDMHMHTLTPVRWANMPVVAFAFLNACSPNEGDLQVDMSLETYGNCWSMHFLCDSCRRLLAYEFARGEKEEGVVAEICPT